MSEFNGDYIKNNQSRPLQLSLQPTDTKKGGREGDLSIVDINIALKSKQRTLTGFVERKIDQNFIKTFPEASGNCILEKYNWLKIQKDNQGKRKFPVVPTLRFNPKTNSIIQTNVSLRGEIIDKHHPLENPDKLTNSEEIITEIARIAKESFADGEGVSLDSDAYAVIIDEKGHGEVILLDLGAFSFKLKNGKRQPFGGESSIGDPTRTVIENLKLPNSWDL